MSNHNQDQQAEEQLVEDIAGFTHDPLGYVLYAYDWGNGELSRFPDGPDRWAREVLTEIGDKLRAGVISGLSEVIQIATASGHGIGKAQPKTLMLHTPDGHRAWGDIQVGEHVFGTNGIPTQVIARHEQGIKQTYRISFDDGSSTLACGEHVWKVRGRAQRRGDSVAGRSGAWIEMTTAEIMQAGVMRKNGIALARQWELPACGAVEFTTQETPVDPYLLGLWLGDGGRNSGRITNIEQDIVEQLDMRDIRYSAGAKVGTDAKTLGIYGLKVQLRALGILDKYSYEKDVPELYRQNSATVRAEVLRGLLDTDGEVAKHGSIVFSSTSKDLAAHVVWLARSLGGKARICPTVKAPFYRDTNGVKINGRPCYRAVLTMPHGFQAFYVKRKQKRIPNVQERYLHRWITSIELASEVDCMCITVAKEDGLYLTNDFIVTHNSALVAWLVDWAMATREDTKGVVTANTDNQLRTKTWAEVAKWHRLSICKHWFKLTATSIYSTDPEHEKSWRIDMIPWSISNTEAFAGLHNQGGRILIIFDEASAIADQIWEVTEGALTDNNTEIVWVAFGNPTQNTGRFRECFRRFRHRWSCRQVDSRTVKISNKDQIAKWIADYGEDSDFVKVRVRGMFPSASAKQFISTTDVDAAQARILRHEQFNFAPKIITVDPAWEGDDEMVIGMRQGLHFEILRVIEKNDNDIIMAGIIADLERQHDADQVFIDNGYGTGIISAGRTMGCNWIGVWFGGASGNPACVNKRAEMWTAMRDWLKDGGSIDPKDMVLYQDLIGPETIGAAGKNIGKIQLESKSDMKKRGLPSPGRGDALAISFAWPVRAKSPIEKMGITVKKQTDYDPYA